ncbi:MAG: ribosome silencing factor [Legionellales bacterium RIFCSPHIGHO2_12_FULL_35_11]|nr:MAG: ribosome silencing factor [Legionellales bacterium RIFCSPHIGHO2_12_FULL_35_11]
MQNITPQLSVLINALEDIKASHISIIDVRNQTTITDYMIICSGRASRHVKAIANHIIPVMKKSGFSVSHLSGVDSGEWILVDLDDCILHIMIPETRDFYNIEGLWQDKININEKVSPA